MVVTASRVVPKSVQICYRGQDLEVIGIVEYRTPPEAYHAADRIRASSFAVAWRLKLIEEPEYKNPERESMN